MHQRERELGPTETHFSYRDVARIFGLKESRLRYWAQTGFINPSARHRGRHLYAFSDLVEIKAAKELLDHGIPLQRVRRNLRALRQALPGEHNLLRKLRVRSDGESLIVVDGTTAVDPISGQAFLDFEIEELRAEVAEVLKLGPKTPPPRLFAGGAPQGPPAVPSTEALPRPGPGAQPALEQRGDLPAAERSAYGWFLKGIGCDGDAGKEEQALAAYQQAIEIDPGLAAAHTNIGNIHHRRGDRSLALRYYEIACALDPDQPEAHYNIANIHEEEGDLDLAIAEYRRALRLAPEFADAHFNLALALEQVGGRQQAIQHWRRYLELTEADASAQPAREVASRHLHDINS